MLNHKGQNRFLLVASYIFYGAWDWRFLFLIFLSTVIDYFCALQIKAAGTEQARKRWLLLSICSNLGILGFFKYFNFFRDNLVSLFHVMGFSPDLITLNVILPVGISFYTFQTMSYTIDVFRKELEPARDFLDFSLYVSFFPQLVAGPIERAAKLLPQVLTPRFIGREQVKQGLWLILWGMFKKIVIADNMAIIADQIFGASGQLLSLSYLVGVYAFALQIYGDFSGYTDIARGLSKLMGFELMVNFRAPYLATNPSDFWRRWHISLSTWLRDYLYVPLGGNRRGVAMTLRNLFLVMTLGGLWHGASWMFVLWGVYHAVLLVFYHLYTEFVQKPLRHAMNALKPSYILKEVWRFLSVFLMFHLTCVGWIFFRARSWDQAKTFLVGIFRALQFQELGQILFYSPLTLLLGGLLVLMGSFYYVNQSDYAGPKRDFFDFSLALRIPILVVLFSTFFIFGVINAKQFIYFQF